MSLLFFHKTREIEAHGGHKQNFVHFRTQEKGVVTHKTEPDLLVVLGSLWRKSGSTVVCLGVRGTDYNSP